TDSYVAKIGDMGIARVIDPDCHHTQLGNVKFMPPEFFHDKYNEKLDIFTFGLTLNELFTETSHDFIFSQHKIQLRKQSPIFTELIARCLANNPECRPTAIEIEKTLTLYDHGFRNYTTKMSN
ncbi:unnamed protein product, partial [Didymodactylos carnosus]